MMCKICIYAIAVGRHGALTEGTPAVLGSHGPALLRSQRSAWWALGGSSAARALSQPASWHQDLQAPAAEKHNTFTTQIIFTSASLFTFASHVLPLDKCCMAGPKAQRHFRLYRTSPTAPCRTNCAAKFWRHALQTQQKGYQMLTQATLWNSPGGRSKALNCCTMLCGRPNGSLGNLARPELEEFVGSLE